jgi:O-antigen/teichoic acid export membrane protein
VGRYAAAYTLISFLLNLGVAYGQALLPSLAALGEDRAAQRPVYDSGNALVTAAGLPLAVGGSILAHRIIGTVFGPGYGQAGLALQILIWSIPVAYLRNVPQAALITAHRQDRVMHTAVWAAAANLALNLLLIPPYGLGGAAVATLLTEILRTALAVRYAQAEGFGLTGPARFWRSGLAAGIMGGVLLLLGPASIWIAVPLGAAVYGLALLAVGGLRLEGGRLPRLAL